MSSPALDREKIQVELEPVDDRGSSMVLSMNLAAGRTSFRTADGDVSRRKRKTLVKGERQIELLGNEEVLT